MNKIYGSLLLTACLFSTGCISAKSELKNTGNNMINLEKTKTYCIGRYTVEIPVEADPLNRYDQYDSFIIKVVDNATRQDFDAAIQEVRKEYSEGRSKFFEDSQEQKVEGRITKVFKGKLADKKIVPFDVFGFVLEKILYF